MPNPPKYQLWDESEPFEDLDKHSEGTGRKRMYISITCPHCNVVFTRVTADRLKTQKSTSCKAHLQECEVYNGKPIPRKRPRSLEDRVKAMKAEVKRLEHLLQESQQHTPVKEETSEQSLITTQDIPSTYSSEEEDNIQPLTVKKEPVNFEVDQSQARVTIYKLVFLPENRPVYTGRTKDLVNRMQQHASRHSQCRLVRNAIRRHGIKSFTIEPIMWCKADDADVNESYWIMQNNTLYPNGYNLRHGSKAGEEVNPRSTLVPFMSDVDKGQAIQAAWYDVGLIVGEA